MSKRYYWLKLKEDFFRSKEIKKLRNQAGGDTYTVIYLKMQLLAMKTDGVLRWTGLEESIAEELALDLDEKPDDVKVTLMYLLKTGLAEAEDESGVFLPAVLENTGSEQASAKRMRDLRARQADMPDRHNVTPLLRDRDVEKEKEKDIEIEKEPEAEKRRRLPRKQYVTAAECPPPEPINAEKLSAAMALFSGAAERKADQMQIPDLEPVERGSV